MTKTVKERLDRQLTEVQHLIAQIDEVSARLFRAADAAVETMNTRTTTKEAPR
jgi:hypothetical protein